MNGADAHCDRTAAVCARGSRAGGSWLVLVTCILASSLAFIDGSVVNVGLFAIGKDLHAGAASLQWVVNAYLLPLSALILLGGAAGDRFGRRAVLIAGTALFALASLGCAMSPSLPWLLAARIAQGVGAAVLMPSSLAILGTTFDGEAKGRAVGVWAATGAALGAIGPVLGGWLIDIASWRAIFLINLPLAAAAIVLAWRFVPEDGQSAGRALDWLGGLIVTAGLAALTYGLTIGTGTAGWSPSAIAATAAGAMLMAGFVFVEARLGAAAMTPLALFASRNLVGLTLLTLLLYGALGALMVLLPYLLVKQGAYSAVAAGAALLPLPIVLAIVSPMMGGWAARIGSRLPLTAGPLVVAAGFLLMLRVSDPIDYWADLMPALLVIALGMSGAVAPLTSSVLQSVDHAHAGAASGFNSAVARLGGMIATALLGSMLAAEGAALTGRFHVACAACAAACVGAAAAVFLLYRDAKAKARTGASVGG